MFRPIMKERPDEGTPPDDVFDQAVLQAPYGPVEGLHESGGLWPHQAFSQALREAPRPSDDLLERMRGLQRTGDFSKEAYDEFAGRPIGPDMSDPRTQLMFLGTDDGYEGPMKEQDDPAFVKILGRPPTDEEYEIYTEGYYDV